MTKEKLRRLIELSEICVSREAEKEKECLLAEFEAWEPDSDLDRAYESRAYWNVRCGQVMKERDEAMTVARLLAPYTRGREGLLPGAVVHLIDTHSWLKENT